MKTAQLPLIKELDLDRIKDSTFSATARKFSPPSSLVHSAVLLALRTGPQPLHQLQRVAGAIDSTALLEELRQLGIELTCHEVPEIVANDEVRICTVCVLTAGGIRRIERWLKTAGGAHV